MTDPATYITGKTVQEQMDQLIGYVDTRSAEVANAAVADEVAACQQCVTDSQDARDAAVAAKDTAVSTVANCVTLNTPQEITAQKTFDVNTIVKNTTPVYFAKDPDEVKGTHAATEKIAGTVYADRNDTWMGGHMFKRETNGDTLTYMSVKQDTVAEAEATLGIKYEVNGDSYGTCPPYPSGAPGNAIATQNNLDNYAAMVRTSGTQTIAGLKRFSNPVQRRSSVDTTNLPGSAVTDGLVELIDTNDVRMGQMYSSFTPGSQTILNIDTKYYLEENGTVKNVTGTLWLAVYPGSVALFLRGKSKDGTEKSTIVASLTL